MKKTILITGATDGIGLETAKILCGDGHHVLAHGRDSAKLDAVSTRLSNIAGAGIVETYVADLSRLGEVDSMADVIIENHSKLDVLINNAGIFKTPQPTTKEGLDIRFVVNTIAPYRLTQRLKKLIGVTGRVINLSSAAQSSVNLAAMSSQQNLDDMEAYAQSKLAITMWSQEIAKESDSPITIAVNPGSLLASKMVKDAFGVEGSDLTIGANILCKAALDDTFGDASGKYFDNDAGRFASPHVDAQDAAKTTAVVNQVAMLSAQLAQSP